MDSWRGGSEYNRRAVSMGRRLHQAHQAKKAKIKNIKRRLRAAVVPFFRWQTWPPAKLILLIWLGYPS